MTRNKNKIFVHYLHMPPHACTSFILQPFIIIGCLSSNFGYQCLLVTVVPSYLSLLFSADCRVVAITICCWLSFLAVLCCCSCWLSCVGYQCLLLIVVPSFLAIVLCWLSCVDCQCLLFSVVASCRSLLYVADCRVVAISVCCWLLLLAVVCCC